MALDHDDTLDFVNPGAAEVCDGEDNTAMVPSTVQRQPMHNRTTEMQTATATAIPTTLPTHAMPDGFSDNDDDCADDRGNANPDGVETCNGIDDTIRSG